MKYSIGESDEKTHRCSVWWERLDSNGNSIERKISGDRLRLYLYSDRRRIAGDDSTLGEFGVYPQKKNYKNTK